MRIHCKVPFWPQNHTDEKKIGQIGADDTLKGPKPSITFGSLSDEQSIKIVHHLV